MNGIPETDLKRRLELLSLTKKVIKKMKEENPIHGTIGRKG